MENQLKLQTGGKGQETSLQIISNKLSKILLDLGPEKTKELSDQIRNVTDVLKGDKKSIYRIGRDYSIAVCKERYDAEKLSELPRKEQMKLISENFPKKQVIGFYKLYILDFLNSVNVKTSLTGMQIDFIASTMFSTYSWTEKDLMLFFRNVKSGFYGQFYENLSPEKLIEWSEIYWHDRIAVAETMNAGQEHFNMNVEKMDPKVFEEMFKGIGEKDSKKEPPILAKKRDTFMDSEKGFRAYLKNVCETGNKEQILSLCRRFRMSKNTRSYVDILLERLIVIDEDSKPYAEALIRMLKLEDEYEEFGQKILLGKIEVLNEIINKFENN